MALALSIQVNGERSLHAGLAPWLDFTTIVSEFDVRLRSSRNETTSGVGPN